MRKPAVLLSALVMIALCFGAIGCDDVEGNSIDWSTDLVDLEADGFWVLLTGKTFYGTEDVRVASELRGDRYIILEAEWIEHNVPMMVQIEFRANASSWWVENMWSYDGTAQGNLKRYECPCGFSDDLGHAIVDDLELECAGGCYEKCGARIHFDNLRLEPFLHAASQDEQGDSE